MFIGFGNSYAQYGWLVNVYCILSVLCLTDGVCFCVDNTACLLAIAGEKASFDEFLVIICLYHLHYYGV